MSVYERSWPQQQGAHHLSWEAERALVTLQGGAKQKGYGCSSDSSWKHFWRPCALLLRAMGPHV